MLLTLSKMLRWDPNICYFSTKITNINVSVSLSESRIARTDSEDKMAETDELVLQKQKEAAARTAENIVSNPESHRYSCRIIKILLFSLLKYY